MSLSPGLRLRQNLLILINGTEKLNEDVTSEIKHLKICMKEIFQNNTI